MTKYNFSLAFLAIIYSIPAITLTICGSEFITLELKHLTLYLAWCLSIVSLFILLCILLHKIKESLGQFNLVLTHLFIYTISLIATYLSVIYHSSINYNILSLATGTNYSEALEFIKSYVFNTKTLYLIIFFTSLILIEISSVKVLNKYYFFRNRTSYILLLLFCAILSLGIPFQINHFKYFTDDSSKNINKIRDDNSLMLYDPICCLYNSYLQIKSNKEDFDTCLVRCNAEKIILDEGRSENIILIIGESHNKYHSSLYGYPIKTNPMLENDSLIVFNDVISPRQITSHSIKAFMSFAEYGSKDKWCNYTLFPALLKKSGYNVCFYSNEFPFYGENSPWNSEAGFLTDGKISKKLFSHQNDNMYKYDGQLIDEFLNNRKNIENKVGRNLIIFQLRGQHFTAKDRFPANFAIFKTEDYAIRKNLTENEKQEIADYDNACIYNDFIIHRIISMYQKSNAIIIYFSDHGEEANDYRAHTGRDFGQLTEDGIHCLLDIPFIVYATDSYKKKHPNIFQLIVQARNTPFSIDNLPHLLSHITGVYTTEYNKSKDPISSSYDMHQRRLVLESLDYDSLIQGRKTYSITYGY